MQTLKKLLSLFLILSLIDNDILYQLQAAPGPDKKSGNVEKFAPPRTIPFDPNTLRREELQQYVHIGKVFSGKSSNGITLIHLRDLHCNYEAQMNISKAIENLEKDLKKAGYLSDHPLLVLTEGADGVVDTGLVSSFPDKEIRKLAGREFVKSGKMTGPEYMSMIRTEERPVQIVGVEDADLYVQDLMAFRNVIGEKPRTLEFLKEVEDWLVMLKERIFSENLLEADEKEGSFHEGALAFDEYVNFLGSKSAENKLIESEKYPNFILMMDLMEKQKEVELEKVEEERNQVMSQLSEKIPKEELAALIKGSLEFRLGKKSAKDYFNGLQSMIEKHLKTGDYPALLKYVDLVRLQSRINHAVLMDEVDILSRKLQEYLTKSEDEKEILEFSRVIQILSRMTSLEMSREDWAYYQENRNRCQVDWIMKEMDRMTLKHSLKLSMNLDDKKKTRYIAKVMEDGEKFYGYALKRDEMMVAKAIQAVEENNAQVAVLITGGFHSDGVTRILEDKDMSYVVATPRVTGEPDMKKYYELMMDQRISVTTISLFSFFNQKLASRFEQMQVKELQGFINTIFQLMNNRRINKSVAQAWLKVLEEKGAKEGLSDADQAILKDIKQRIGVEDAAQEIPALGESEIKELITNKNYNVLTAELTIQVLEDMNHPMLAQAREWYAQRVLGLEKLRERPKLVNDVEDARHQLTSLLSQGGVTDLSFIQEAFDLLVKASETVLTTGEEGRYHELYHSFEVTLDSLSNALKGGIKGGMLEALAFAALFHDLAVLEKGSSVYAVHEELSAKRFFDILSGMIERAPPEDAKRLQNIQDWGTRFILMTQFTGAFFVPANLYNLMNNDIVETEGGTGLQFRSEKTADTSKYPAVVSKVSLEPEALNDLRKVGAAIGIADLKSALSSERYLFMLEGLFDEYVISDQRRAGSTFLANLGWVSAYDAFKGTWGFIQFGLLLPGVGRLANFNAVLGPEAGVLAENNLQNLSVNRAIFQKLQGLIETVRKGQPLSGDQLTLLRAFRELIQDNEQLLSPESSEVLKNLLTLLEADHSQISGQALREDLIRELRIMRERPFFSHEAHKILVKNAEPADIKAANVSYQADKKNEETYRKALAEAEGFLRQRTPVDEALKKAQDDLKTAPVDRQDELNAEINRLKGEGTKYPPAMMLSNRIHFYSSKLNAMQSLASSLAQAGIPEAGSEEKSGEVQTAEARKKAVSVEERVTKLAESLWNSEESAYAREKVSREEFQQFITDWVEGLQRLGMPFDQMESHMKPWLGASLNNSRKPFKEFMRDLREQMTALLARVEKLAETLWKSEQKYLTGVTQEEFVRFIGEWAGLLRKEGMAIEKIEEQITQWLGYKLNQLALDKVSFKQWMQEQRARWAEGERVTKLAESLWETEQKYITGVTQEQFVRFIEEWAGLLKKEGMAIEKIEEQITQWLGYKLNQLALDKVSFKQWMQEQRARWADQSVPGGRGYGDEANETFTEGIREKLIAGEIASFTVDQNGDITQTEFQINADVVNQAGTARRDGDHVKVSEQEKNVPLSDEQRKRLAKVIQDLGLAPFLKGTQIVFAKGQKAHYSVGRNQIYLDTALLDNEGQLKRELLHETLERDFVVNGIRADPELQAELERTALTPEEREKTEVGRRLNVRINELAGEMHNLLIQEEAREQAIEVLGPPDISKMAMVGQAHIGGEKDKEFWVDEKGELWIFKLNPYADQAYRPKGVEAFYQFVQRYFGYPGQAHDVTLNGRRGTLEKALVDKSVGDVKWQELTVLEINAIFREFAVPNLRKQLTDESALDNLSDDQVKDILQEMVLDWLFSNHDAHAANFLISEDGRIIGIDKEQVFKYFPNDKLDLNYHPNGNGFKYQPLFQMLLTRLAARGKLDPALIEAALSRMESISDAALADLIRPFAEEYVQAHPDRFPNREAFVQAFLERKKNLRKDFKDFFDRVNARFKPSDGIKDASKEELTILLPPGSTLKDPFKSTLDGLIKFDPSLFDNFFMPAKPVSTAKPASAKADFNEQVEMNQRMGGMYELTPAQLERIKVAKGDPEAVAAMIEERFQELLEQAKPEDRQALIDKKNELLAKVRAPPASANKLKALFRLLTSWASRLKEAKPDYHRVHLARDGGFFHLVDKALEPATEYDAGSSVYHLSRARMTMDVYHSMYNIILEAVDEAKKRGFGSNVKELNRIMREKFQAKYASDPQFRAVVNAVRKELEALGYDKMKKLIFTDTGFLGTIPFFLKQVLEVGRTGDELYDEAGEERIQVALVQPSSIHEFARALFGFDLEALSADERTLVEKLAAQFDQGRNVGAQLEDIRAHPVRFNESAKRIEETNPASQLEVFYEQILAGQMVQAYQERQADIDEATSDLPPEIAELIKTIASKSDFLDWAKLSYGDFDWGSVDLQKSFQKISLDEIKINYPDLLRTLDKIKPFSIPAVPESKIEYKLDLSKLEIRPIRLKELNLDIKDLDIASGLPWYTRWMMNPKVPKFVKAILGWGVRAKNALKEGIKALVYFTPQILGIYFLLERLGLRGPRLENGRIGIPEHVIRDIQEKLRDGSLNLGGQEPAVRETLDEWKPETIDWEAWKKYWKNEGAFPGKISDAQFEEKSNDFNSYLNAAFADMYRTLVRNLLKDFPDFAERSGISPEALDSMSLDDLKALYEKLINLSMKRLIDRLSKDAEFKLNPKILEFIEVPLGETLNIDLVKKYEITPEMKKALDEMINNLRLEKPGLWTRVVSGFRSLRAWFEEYLSKFKSLMTSVEEFMAAKKRMGELVPHSVVNRYIADNIPQDLRENAGIITKYPLAEYRGAQAHVIEIEGLFQATGQLAHIGLGQVYGQPVIYVDKRLEGEDRQRTLEHELFEIGKWEAWRQQLGKEPGQMRAWIQDNINEAELLADEWHRGAPSVEDILTKYRAEVGIHVAGMKGAYGDDGRRDINLAAGVEGTAMSEADVKGFIREYVTSRLGMDRVRLIAGLAEALSGLNIPGTLLDAALNWAVNELDERGFKFPENAVNPGESIFQDDVLKAGDVFERQQVSRVRWDRIGEKVKLLISGKFVVNRNGKIQATLLSRFVEAIKRLVATQGSKDQLRTEQLDENQQKSADAKAKSEADEQLRQITYLNYAQEILNERLNADELGRLISSLELDKDKPETEGRAKRVLLGYLLGQFTGDEGMAKNYLGKKDYALLDDQGLNLEQAYDESTLLEGLVPESDSLEDREKLLAEMAEKTVKNEEAIKQEDESLMKLFVHEASPVMKRMDNLIDRGIVRRVEKDADQSVVVLDIHSLVKLSEEKDGRMRFEGRGVGLSEAVEKLFDVRPGTRVKLMSPYGEEKTKEILKSLGIDEARIGSAKGQVQIVGEWSKKGFEEILRGAMGENYSRENAQKDVVVILSEETKNELQKKDMGKFVKEMKIVVGKLGGDPGAQTINDVLGMALILASVDKAFEKGQVTQAVADALNELITEMLREILSKDDLSDDEFGKIQAKMLKQISTEGFFRVPPVTDSLNDMMRQIAIEHAYIDVAA